jgi:hypothetical protein
VSDGVTCAPWRPAPEFDDRNGAISADRPDVALDCSSGICMPVAMQRSARPRSVLLLIVGRALSPLAAARRESIAFPPKALARDGRKFFGMSALFDGNAGTPYAYVESTWIIAGVTRSEAFGAR